MHILHTKLFSYIPLRSYAHLPLLAYIHIIQPFFTLIHTKLLLHVHTIAFIIAFAVTLITPITPITLITPCQVRPSQPRGECGGGEGVRTEERVPVLRDLGEGKNQR